MPETERAHELHHAHERIAQLEQMLARDRQLLQSTHAQLHAIQSTHIWKLAAIYYRLRDRILPPHSRGYRMFKSAVKWCARNARALVRRLRSANAPGGRLGRNVCLDDRQYQRWIRRYEPTSSALARQRQHRFGWEPLLSVVMPVYRPRVAMLRAAIDSLLAQTYANWEVCLADASCSNDITDLLDDYSRRDARIRVVTLPHNLGIAGNTNAALQQARGEFVAFMDHDDTLAPFALFEIARVLNEEPNADFLYSDEDKLDPSGRRVEPHFKPDWSPEYLRSLNYICHLLVLKRDLVTKLGGLRDGFEGAQDYDLVLRAAESARQILHIPKVLYHWRMHAASTAASVASKPTAYEAGRRALQEHFDRTRIGAAVACRDVPGIYGVRYALVERPLVSIIIPNRDQPRLLRRCLDSIRRNTYDRWKVLIVENGSVEEETHTLYRELEQHPQIRRINWSELFNFSAVNNFAARQAQGELLLFLNNDVEAERDDWLQHMLELAVQPRVGAVGAKLLYPDNTIQHGGIILGMGGIAGHTHLNFPADAPGYMRRLQFPHNVAAVTAACMMVPRRVFESIGGFDEGFVLAFGDVDLCLKIRQAGFRIVWTPDAELRHHESKTRGYEDTASKKLRFTQEVELFRSKWSDQLSAGDPYYSPHFRLDRCDWMLRG